MQPPRILVGGLSDPATAPVASRTHLVRFLLIVAAITAGTSLQAHSVPKTALASRVPLYLILIAVEVLMVRYVAIGIHARRRKVIDLFGRSWRNTGDALLDIGLAGGLMIVLLMGTRALHHLFGSWPSNTGFLLPKTPVESVLWLGVSFAAGICEELVYRGYLQAQLWGMTKSLPLAIVLQAAVFGCGHIYQGWKPAALTALYGLLFGLTAAWRRSIIPSAIAHIGIDILGGLAR